jgi:anhydro-N-acetylmuramic acid kinase
MERLGRELPAARIMSADSAGIPAEWKECLCFAYLAYRTLGGLPSNLPSVTGASRSTILGVVGYPGT